jgi:hypothetical protein
MIIYPSAQKAEPHVISWNNLLARTHDLSYDDYKKNSGCSGIPFLRGVILSMYTAKNDHTNNDI